MTALVVGANGQLGFLVAEQLAARGEPVLGSVRTPARGAGLAEAGVEVVVTDLAAPDGLRWVLERVDTVVLTANPAVPRSGDDPAAVYAGMGRLVRDAAAAGVRRFVLPSVSETDIDASAPLFANRRYLETQLTAIGIPHSIIRFPPFMECWLALIGSSLPLRGEPRATIGRPSPFLRLFRRATGSLVEDHGLMLVPGSPANRNSFIIVTDADAARACVECAVGPARAATTLQVGGPQALTWKDIAGIFSEVLDRRVRIVSTPAAVYAAAATVLGPVAKVPAATMALNRALAVSETVYPPGGGILAPSTMMSVRDVLRAKSALTKDLPTVI
jgi:uncharacterized protein YbjT (DUF2867 family)